jgi:phage-related tail protein
VKTLYLFISLSAVLNAMATVPSYQETENEGMTKPERFSSIEKQLIEVSKAVNEIADKNVVAIGALSEKINENSKRIKLLEDQFKLLKPADKTAEHKVSDKPASLEDEMKKLKADFLSLKNQDMEKMSIELHELSLHLKQLESTAR